VGWAWLLHEVIAKANQVINGTAVLAF
jgi:hypothetical protein